VTRYHGAMKRLHPAAIPFAWPAILFASLVFLTLPAAILFASLVFFTPPAAAADDDLLQRGRDLLRDMSQQPAPNAGGSARSASELTTPQIDSGLREALRVAAQRTVQRVSKPGGFLKDDAIHIPLPGRLEDARKALDAAGMGGSLDDLETRMNRAAEEASASAYKIFADRVSKISLGDARGILTGPKDAATQYLRRTSSGDLTAAFRPIVDHALAEAGAMKLYKSVSDRVSSGMGSFGSLLGGDAAKPGGFDFTGFVVDKAMDGLFHYIAEEEAAIRTNPVARTTDLLKQVFGRS